jgi:hypothetical protein
MVAQQQCSSFKQSPSSVYSINGQLVAQPTGICYQAICTPENVGQSESYDGTQTLLSFHLASKGGLLLHVDFSST